MLIVAVASPCFRLIREAIRLRIGKSVGCARACAWEQSESAGRVGGRLEFGAVVRIAFGRICEGAAYHLVGSGGAENQSRVFAAPAGA